MRDKIKNSNVPDESNKKYKATKIFVLKLSLKYFCFRTYLDSKNRK